MRTDQKTCTGVSYRVALRLSMREQRLSWITRIVHIHPITVFLSPAPLACWVHIDLLCAAAVSALDATLDSGIRAIFGYTVPTRMSQWDQSQCVPEQDLIPEWAVQQLGNLI